MEKCNAIFPLDIDDIFRALKELQITLNKLTEPLINTVKSNDHYHYAPGKWSKHMASI